MNHRLALAAFLTLLPLAAFVGCSDDETGDNGPSGPGSGAASSSGSSSSGPGANGGSGGSGAEGGAGAAGGTGGTGTTGGAGGAGGGTGGGGTAADHLVISEFVVKPGPAEFVEIHNPTNAAIDLSDYWLSDNSAYYTAIEGGEWQPITDNAGSDFAAKFPDGASIPGGGYITVAFSGASFETTYAACPTFVAAEADFDCEGAPTAAAMSLADTEGGVPTGLSDSREMIVLFQWDGAANTVKDVDYVLWGASEEGTFVDKTGVAGYAADTAQAMQKAIPEPGANQGFQRCPDGSETAEKASGGNGLSGHDETSEDLASAFQAVIAPPNAGATTSPGAANACN
jgi:hypothetical protein